MQMVPGSAVGSANPLKPVTILAVAYYVIDQNSTGAISETYAKYLMDTFPQMGTKSGGWIPATAPHWARSSTSKGYRVVPNRYLCAKICMIWVAMTKGEYKDDQMTPNQLDSHESMVVVG